MVLMMVVTMVALMVLSSAVQTECLLVGNWVASMVLMLVEQREQCWDLKWVVQRAPWKVGLKVAKKAS